MAERQNLVLIQGGALSAMHPTPEYCRGNHLARRVGIQVDHRAKPRIPLGFRSNEGWVGRHGQFSIRTLSSGIVPDTMADDSRPPIRQLAHQSMISRRFIIVPPALPNSGHAEQLGKQARSLPAT
jgi:hypothetical protein